MHCTTCSATACIWLPLQNICRTFALRPVCTVTTAKHSLNDAGAHAETHMLLESPTRSCYPECAVAPAAPSVWPYTDLTDPSARRMPPPLRTPPRAPPSASISADIPVCIL